MLNPKEKKKKGGSCELGVLESCGSYRAGKKKMTNVISVEGQRHKRCTLLECRAVVIANLP